MSAAVVTPCVAAAAIGTTLLESAGIDVVLLLLVAGMAFWCVAARDVLASILAFIACGVLVTLAWMRLGAPDVALTEAAVGAGLTGMLMLSAAGACRVPRPSGRQDEARLSSPPRRAGATPSPVAKILGACLCAALSAALVVVVLRLPDPAPTLAPQVDASLVRLGLENPVNGVLLGFRGLDTLIEKVVLLMALVAIWSLAPDAGWGGRPVMTSSLRHGPLALLGRVLPPIGIVVAVAMLWISATQPGGAFAASSVLAAMWLLVLMSGLARAPAITSLRLRIGLAVGPLLFFAIGLAGMGMAGAFLAFPESWAKPLIVVLEYALLVSIAMTLALMFAGPPRSDLPEAVA